MVVWERLRELEDGKVAAQGVSEGRASCERKVIQGCVVVIRPRRQVSRHYAFPFYVEMPQHRSHVIVRPDELAIGV